MKVDYDPQTRNDTLAYIGLDFEDFRQILAGFHIHFVLNDEDDGVERYASVGYVDDQLVAAVWSPRDDVFYVLSMRMADDDERELFKQELEQSG